MKSPIDKLWQEASLGNVLALRELQSLGYNTRIISYNPLHAAILHGDATAVEELLQTYNVNETAEFNMNALHRACLMTEVNYDIIMMLLRSGPQLNAVDQYGHTFVHILSLYSNISLLDFINDIIRLDAEKLTHLLNIPNYFGKTAAEHAAMRHDHQMLFWLKEYGANLETTSIMQNLLEELAINTNANEITINLLQDRYHIARSIFLLNLAGIGAESFENFPFSPLMTQTITHEGERETMPEYIIIPPPAQQINSSLSLDATVADTFLLGMEMDFHK